MMVLADPLFSEQTTQRPQPRYGEMLPANSYMHLKITFLTNDRKVQHEFSDEFSAFVNRYIEQHGLPMERQEALLTPAGSGLFSRHSALKTQLVLTAHLDDQKFKDFTAAIQELLEGMPSVVQVRCTNYHHHVIIAASGHESH